MLCCTRRSPNVLRTTPAALPSVTPPPPPESALVLRVESPIVAPVQARAGDFLLIEPGENGAPTTIAVVRRTTADPATLGAVAALVSSGSVSALQVGTAARLAALASAPRALALPTRVRPTLETPRRAQSSAG